MCHGLLYLHLLSIVLYSSTTKRRTVLVLLGRFGGVKYAIQDKIQDNVASSLPSPRVFNFFFFFFKLTRLLREATSQGVRVVPRMCGVRSGSGQKNWMCGLLLSTHHADFLSTQAKKPRLEWPEKWMGWGWGWLCSVPIQWKYLILTKFFYNFFFTTP